MINWKIPAAFGGFGAIVSLLAGIIGGNPFGVILLRLVLSAGVCGGLGLGVNLTINKFLPELSAHRPAAPKESGEEVNIVIDEEIPLPEEGADLQGGELEEAGEVAALVEPEEPAETSLDGAEDALPAEEAESGDLAPAEPFLPGIEEDQVTDFQNLDTLPDIDRFSPGTEESPPSPRPSRSNSKVEEVVRDQDPENLARAVRTFMKKDQ